MDVYKMTEYRWKARIELEYLIKRTGANPMDLKRGIDKAVKRR